MVFRSRKKEGVAKSRDKGKTGLSVTTGKSQLSMDEFVKQKEREKGGGQASRGVKKKNKIKG